MGRPREFDRRQVLIDATEVFMKKGFSATTMRDLVEATGLNESSLYNAFGNKRDFFLEVLREFQGDIRAFAAQLDAVPSPKQKIHMLFGRLADTVAYPTSRSCLLMFAVNELGDADDEIRAQVRNTYGEMTEQLASLIDQAKAAGEISSNLDTRNTALFLTNTYQGMRSAAVMRPTQEECRAIAQVALSVLDT